MRAFLDAFARDERGVVAVELVLVVPILVWALLSTFVYFDVFRVESNTTRASLTVADMFSREKVPITDAYLDGARSLLEALTFEESNPDYRITVYRYQEFDDKYLVVWADNRGMGPDTDDDRLEAIRDRLPILANGDRAILLETRVEYDAPFDIGIGAFAATNLEDVTFTTFTVIRPRANTLCFDTTPADTTTGLSC